jgi:hypothetical protein
MEVHLQYPALCAENYEHLTVIIVDSLKGGDLRKFHLLILLRIEYSSTSTSLQVKACCTIHDGLHHTVLLQ